MWSRKAHSCSPSIALLRARRTTNQNDSSIVNKRSKEILRMYLHMYSSYLASFGTRGTLHTWYATISLKRTNANWDFGELSNSQSAKLKLNWTPAHSFARFPRSWGPRISFFSFGPWDSCTVTHHRASRRTASTWITLAKQTQSTIHKPSEEADQTVARWTEMFC